MKLALASFGLALIAALVWTANGKHFLVKTNDNGKGTKYLVETDDNADVGGEVMEDNEETQPVTNKKTADVAKDYVGLDDCLDSYYRDFEDCREHRELFGL